MLTIAMLQFNKPKNSTRRPEIFLQENLFQGEIKGDFSPMALEVTFNFTNPAAMPKYNYAYIYPFKRYYFITAWTFVGGLWTASFTVDVLATYREEIKESTQYILRSESDPSPDIIDTTWMQRGGVISTVQGLDDARTFWGLPSGVNSGTVVCGIVGGTEYNVGAVTHYAMTYAAFNNLMNVMLSSPSWMGISSSEISNELQKALINPTQYIVSATWLPCGLSLISGTQVSQLKLGWWYFNISNGVVKAITDPTATLTFNTSINIQKHYQINSLPNMRFLNLAPYSRYSLSFLPFGVFELDSGVLYNYDKLVLQVKFSPLTGDAVLYVKGGDLNGTVYPEHLLVTTCKVGVPVPTGQVAANLGNATEALTLGAAVGVNDLINHVTR